jgi:hypothetical protein
VTERQYKWFLIRGGKRQSGKKDQGGDYYFEENQTALAM